jgi:two-component system, LytTR family, sensor kinase
MRVPDAKYFDRPFLKGNLRYGLIGPLAALVISLFESIFANKIIPQQQIICNLIFATVITLSIVNSMYVLLCFWRPKKGVLWQFVAVYYGCNMLGMLIGIELSYLLVSAVYHVPFHFMSHSTDYRFNFLIILVISTIVYIYRSRQANLTARLREKELDLVKAKQLVTQAELQTLQSKINPHFLYNSLNSIAGLIREDADKAEDMTLKLSQLFRYSINSRQENLATVAGEMEIVNTYLEIEKVRFGSRLQFMVDIDSSVKESHIPKFLIQPLVENALKHGLNGLADNGCLKISIGREKEKIAITIADNGKPFPAELNMGYGLQSTYDKLNLLYADDYQVQITNSPEKQIRIIIPASV